MKVILSVLSIFAVLLVAPLFMFGASITTTAGVSGGNYVDIPEAIREYYSREVLFEAEPRLKFLQFAKRKTDLTAVRGKSISFTKYSTLTGGGAIAENALLESVGMSTAEVIINVAERGNAVTVTELAIRTSPLDVLGDASKLLGANMAKVLDTEFRDTVLGTTNVVFGAGKSAHTDLSEGDGLDTVTVKDAVEILAGNNAPKIAGEYYVCVAHPHQLRQLRDDPNWISAHAYRGTGRQLFLGEVGMYEGVIFIETTQMPELNASQITASYGAGHTLTTGWECVFFGDNAYAWAIALPVELRDDGVNNLGRFHTIGWYGIWGTGIIEENNIVKGLTA